MKLKYLLVAILIFLFMAPNTYARCSTTDVLRVKSIANDVTIETNMMFDESGKETGKFSLIFKGLTDEIEVFEEIDGEKQFYKPTNGVVTINNVESGSHKYQIFYTVCAESVRTIRHTLPKYNYYANDPLCEGIDKEQLSVCDKWYQEDLDEETFKQKIEEYKNILKKEQEEQEKENRLFNKIINFVKDYYIFIIAIVVVIIIITSTIIIRRKRGMLE